MKIIAIGGGEIRTAESFEIDKEIIHLSEKAKPRLLFIPTASSDSEGYVDTIQNYFGKKLHCEIDTLYLLEKNLTPKEIERKILNTNIIYVGGGNTLKMMNVWRKNGIDNIIKKAVKKGIVLSGVSAGAICWFKYGSSDSRRFYNPKADLIRVKGLELINALFCPHYDVEKDRKPDLKKLMKKTTGIAIALDNCCAIEIVGNSYRIISSKSSANAYKVYWKNGVYVEQVIKKDRKFEPMATLLRKS